MCRVMKAAVSLSVALMLAVPAVAQTRLPRTSPAERRVQELNRNMQLEQRFQRSEQQYQFNNNQLQQSIDRQRVFSNPSPPARIGTCPAGSVGC
ncbi:hypothetical protein [Microvirga puerhi]|uniref:Uncharacterized protein n=1 Tax=Microvirga puerhi TaxID=2876078 RepID=A0ABS7VIB5_9HYPH|nr:hypothetical protein [Microvirga puerhi]MBZ6075246.1 hypothetical protein [Microvirga puerhi]